MKLKLETASSGDFVTKGKLIPSVKDAFISFKEKDYKIRFGIQSPPTFSMIKALWGYRSLEKTSVDLQKWSSSRDFGISLTKKGDFFSFALMFGNSSSNKSEVDKEKRLYASFGITPVEALYIEIYGDYNGLFASYNQYLVHGFVSYKTTSFRIGLLYSRKGSLNDNTSNNLVSCYAVYSLKEGLDFILRYDKTMEANTKGEDISYIPFSSASPANFVLTGISYTISNKVQIMPNVKFVYYDSASVSYDLYPNLTL